LGIRVPPSAQEVPGYPHHLLISELEHGADASWVQEVKMPEVDPALAAQPLWPDTAEVF
jgi:hypothetical protein